MTNPTPQPGANSDLGRLSLHPLTFDEALEALLDAPVEETGGGDDDGDEGEGPR
jgi:hypothetical protein